MAATNLRQFNARVRKLTKSLPRDQQVRFQKKIVLEALRRIVLKTPVKTGRARGNWQTTINTRPGNVLDVRSGDRNPISAGLSALGRLRPGQIVYLTNNVPYIIFLEEGTPNMAPIGMVKTTVQELTIGLGI